MKIYLKYYDVLEILARHFDLPTKDVSSPPKKESVLAWDELYWEGKKWKA